MKFDSPLDELQHWLGVLTIDVRLGVDRRHLLCNARLCWLLVDRLERDPGNMDQEMFTRLSLTLLDLQRQIDPPRRAIRRPVIVGPRLRLVSPKRGTAP